MGLQGINLLLLMVSDLDWEAIGCFTECEIDTWMQPFGDRYVQNYTEQAKGKLEIDIVDALKD